MADPTQLGGILGKIHSAIDPSQYFGGYGGTAMMGMGGAANPAGMLEQFAARPVGVSRAAYGGKFKPEELQAILGNIKPEINQYSKKEIADMMQNFLDDAYFGGLGYASYKLISRDTKNGGS